MAIFYECLKSFREYLFELNLKTEPQKQIALKSSAESVTVLSIEQTRYYRNTIFLEICKIV